MLHALLLATGLSLDPGTSLNLTESTHSSVQRKVYQEGIAETLTSISSKWKVEATVPFTQEEWTRLGQGGTVTLSVGKQTLTQKVGFDAARGSYAFRLTRPVVVSTGFKYLVLPSDPPPSPAPPKGTETVYATGSLSFTGSSLRVSLSSFGDGAPSLAGENYVGLGNGSFEGKLPLELSVGDRSSKFDLAVSGSLKHKGIKKTGSFGDEVQSLVGDEVQMLLSGRG